MYMHYYDTEHNTIVTREELEHEFELLHKTGDTDAQTPTEYIRNCMVWNDGTLEPYIIER